MLQPAFLWQLAPNIWLQSFSCHQAPTVGASHWMLVRVLLAGLCLQSPHT